MPRTPPGRASVKPPNGVGLGLRAPLVDDLLASAPDELRWIEVAPENYLERGGAFMRQLARCRERWPVVTHGLTMSLGGCDPLDDHYLAAIDRFARDVGSPWHSDHLCFGSVEGAHLHDLLPLPYTREAVRHVSARVSVVQRALAVPLAIENVSAYAHPGEAEFDEATMIREVVAATGVGLLLDVNNLYVNAKNVGADARRVLDDMPLEAVVQFHVAGHFTRDDGLRVDTHGERVCDDVYALLEHALARTGPRPVLLERDQNFPPWPELVAEIRRLDALYRRATGETA
jgi:uncharacterized protein (UPF0276 family)